MKKLISILFITITLFLSACAPSESQIATAIAETKIAALSETPPPTNTIIPSDTPIPSITPSPAPTVPEGCNWEEYETILNWGFSVLITSMESAMDDIYHPFENIQDEISGITNLGMGYILSNYCANHAEITDHLLNAYMEYIAALEVAQEHEDTGLYHPDAMQHIDNALESLQLVEELTKEVE